MGLVFTNIEMQCMPPRSADFPVLMSCIGDPGHQGPWISMSFAVVLQQCNAVY